MNAAILEVTSDETTRKVHIARRNVQAASSAFPKYELFGIKAYPNDVENAHSRASFKFDLFSGMGHGGDDCFEGQYGTTIFDTTFYNTVNKTVRGTIVHLYSCNCGKSLGQYLVRNGAKAFIGYRSLVIVPSTQSIVDEFVKVAATIDQSILNGDSSAITKQKADATFTAVEARLLSPQSAATPRDVASFRMNHNAIVGPWTSSNYGSY